MMKHIVGEKKETENFVYFQFYINTFLTSAAVWGVAQRVQWGLLGYEHSLSKNSF